MFPIRRLIRKGTSASRWVPYWCVHQASPQGFPMTIDANAAAPEGVQAPDILPGETIATEMPSSPETETPPVPEPEVEEPSAEAEPAAAPEPDGKTKPTEKQPLSWQEKRRIEETNKRRAAEARAATAEAELERLRKAAATPPSNPAATPATISPAATLTPDQARAAARAELEAEAAANAFSEATGRVLAAGIANIPDFESARTEMVQNFGDQLNARPDFFEAITSLDNGHEVFYDLAKDPERTEKLLAMSPVRLAIEIAKLGDKKAAPAAPEVRPISKAPAPVKPVGGAPAASDRLDDPSVPMDQWAKTYLKQVAGKGR